jgi:regulatory protein
MPTTKLMSEHGLAGEGRSATAPTREMLLGRALALLARREHSSVEIRGKLADFGGDAVKIEAIIADLQLRKLQSDTRFAEMFVRSRAERGYGPRAIEMGLRERGIDRDAAAVALEASGYDWRVQAVEVRQRRFGEGLPTVARERARQLRFLQYRGFAGREISAALKGEVVDD